MTAESPRRDRRWGLRSRVQRLYGSRRLRILSVPRTVLERRYGSGRVTADDDHRWLRVDLDGDTVVEVGFAGTFRMFGALIDTRWTARRGTVGADTVTYGYRFDRQQFRAPAGGDPAVAARLGDATTVRLAGRSELKRLNVAVSDTGRRVELTPLAGTITAVYFPPMPPYTVLLREAETTDHLDLVLHLLSLPVSVY